MVRSRTNRGSILVIDNDVLVYLFDYLFSSNYAAFERVILYLSLSYGRIWIPGKVKDEFLYGKYTKKRSRTISHVYGQYNAVGDCPIKVGLSEIILLIGSKEENRGEADAIIQSQKAKTRNDLFFENIVFLSNDHLALELAVKQSVKILPYSELKSRMAETEFRYPSQDLSHTSPRSHQKFPLHRHGINQFRELGNMSNTTYIHN